MTTRTWAGLAVLAALSLVLGAGYLGAQGRGNQQVTICHRPPGNPGNAQTITVGKPAVNAHLGHGDSVGACPGSPKK